MTREKRSQQDNRKQVLVRLDRDVVKRVDHLAVEWDVFRGEAMEILLRIALDQAERKKTKPSR